MLSLMMSLTLYKVSQKSSLAPGERNKCIHKNIKAAQVMNSKSFAPPRKHPRCRNLKSSFETLFEPPVRCCDLYNEEIYNCILHSRLPPYEYYAKLLSQAQIALERSYRVDLFVFNKRCEKEFRVLHMERRKKLGLQDLDEDEDIPRFNPRTRKEMRKLVGKLCIFHKLDYNIEHCPRGATECFMCKCDVARKQHRAAHRQLYTDYRSKVFDALDNIHKTMGYNMFKISDPTINPTKEWAQDTTRNNSILYITDWSENQQGQPGNLITCCRDHAQYITQLKAKIWNRMAGRSESEVTKASWMGSRVLNTITEEEE